MPAIDFHVKSFPAEGGTPGPAGHWSPSFKTDHGLSHGALANFPTAPPLEHNPIIGQAALADGALRSREYSIERQELGEKRSLEL
jgi:hypothetical protein